MKQVLVGDDVQHTFALKRSDDSTSIELFVANPEIRVYLYSLKVWQSSSRVQEKRVHEKVFLEIS